MMLTAKDDLAVVLDDSVDSDEDDSVEGDLILETSLVIFLDDSSEDEEEDHDHREVRIFSCL